MSDAIICGAMDIGLSKIAAASQRQALDWSLVLASQGIETIIAQGEGGEGWGLLVSAHDYQTAQQAIHLYRTENHGWPWKKQEVWPGLLFDWASGFWVVLLGILFWLDTKADLRPAGLMLRSAV